MSSSDYSDSGDEWMPDDDDVEQMRGEEIDDLYTPEFDDFDVPDLIGDEDDFAVVLPTVDERGMPEFTGADAGPTSDTVYQNEVDCFKAFIDEDIIDFILDCTNRRAATTYTAMPFTSICIS